MLFGTCSQPQYYNDLHIKLLCILCNTLYLVLVLPRAAVSLLNVMDVACNACRMIFPWNWLVWFKVTDLIGWSCDVILWRIKTVVCLPHLGTILARCAVFPVIIKGQRETAKLNNVMPEMTKLNNRMNEAKQSGNKFECKQHLWLTFLKCLIKSISSYFSSAMYALLLHCDVGVLLCCECMWAIDCSFLFFSFNCIPVAKAYSDMMLFQKKHDVHPLRGFVVPLVQVSKTHTHTNQQSVHLLTYSLV